VTPGVARAAVGGGPSRADRLLAQPAGFVALLLAYVVVHAGLRLGLSSILTIDDSREALFAQTFEWGYQARQPPLYNWLVWGAFRVFGVGVLGLTVVKYAVLSTAYAFLYLTARRVLTRPDLAALSALSLLLMVPITWVVHEALTHSVAVLAAAAATVYVLLRLEATGRWGAYVALGVTLALGILSKFSYSLFAGSLLLAALTVDRFRARLWSPRLLVSLGVGALLVAPFVAWFYHHDFSLARMYAEEVDPGEAEPYALGVVSAVYYVARVTLYYLTPLWLVYLVLFRGAWSRRGDEPGPARPARRLLGRFFLAQFGILAVAALVAGLTYLKFRWLLAAFILFPLYVFSRVDAARLDPARIRRFAALLALAEVLVLLAFAVNIYRGDRFGRPSRLNAPYDVVAARLAEAGFRRGTIAAGEGPLAGNLRLWFPDSRIMRLTNPDYVPPEKGGGQCLIAWEKGPADTVPAEIRSWLAAALDLPLSGGEPVRAVEAPYHHSARRTLVVRYVLLDGGRGRCR
jgi:4-amino-4-deoxy-L-arabinose transferase-like glycosyltransferase